MSSRIFQITRVILSKMMASRSAPKHTSLAGSAIASLLCSLLHEDEMAQLVTLSGEILHVVFIRIYFKRHAFHNF